MNYLKLHKLVKSRYGSIIGQKRLNFTGKIPGPGPGRDNPDPGPGRDFVFIPVPVPVPVPAGMKAVPSRSRPG